MWWQRYSSFETQHAGIDDNREKFQSTLHLLTFIRSTFSPHQGTRKPTDLIHSWFPKFRFLIHKPTGKSSIRNEHWKETTWANPKLSIDSFMCCKRTRIPLSWWIQQNGCNSCYHFNLLLTLRSSRPDAFNILQQKEVNSGKSVKLGDNKGSSIETQQLEKCSTEES